VEREVDAKKRKGPRPDEDAKSVDDLGDCLRISFSAENHDSLSDDMRRLMLHLAREPAAPPKA
jgi:hypothetical protein